MQHDLNFLKVKSERIHNLDLLRAIAIVMVLIYHIFQDLPYPIQWLSEYGKYGVHLFFALSGYLIGGLWFQEHKENGSVNTIRFMAKRALRTMPPYFVAFGIYFSLRQITSDAPFNWRFLVFSQNYLDSIPYYDISWSLCIEEHFYLVLPLSLGILFKYLESNNIRLICLIAIAILPILLRYLEYERPVYFGYHTTATHLNYDFLAYGVIGAFIQQNYSEFTRKIGLRLPFILLIVLVIFTSFLLMPAKVYYCFGLPILALTLGLLVTAMASTRSFALAKTRLIYGVAITSYSLYLTHVLALNVSERLVLYLNLSSAYDVLLSILLIFAGGAAYYYFVEKATLTFRTYLLDKSR